MQQVLWVSITKLITCCFIVGSKPETIKDGSTSIRVRPFFITGDDTDINFRARKPAPNLDDIIRRAKQLPKEVRLKKSKIVKKYKEIVENKVRAHANSSQNSKLIYFFILHQIDTESDVRDSLSLVTPSVNTSQNFS